MSEQFEILPPPEFCAAYEALWDRAFGQNRANAYERTEAIGLSPRRAQKMHGDIVKDYRALDQLIAWGNILRGFARQIERGVDPADAISTEASRGMMRLVQKVVKG